VPPKPGDKKDIATRLIEFGAQRQQAENHGVGWVLTLVEAMRSEWSCTLRQAMFEESLTAALELWPAMMIRYGASPGLSYVDKARQKAKEAARKWIAENFRVVDPKQK
jgi:hypothetical protein